MVTEWGHIVPAIGHSFETGDFRIPQSMALGSALYAFSREYPDVSKFSVEIKHLENAFTGPEWATLVTFEEDE